MSLASTRRSCHLGRSLTARFGIVSRADAPLKHWQVSMWGMEVDVDVSKRDRQRETRKQSKRSFGAWLNPVSDSMVGLAMWKDLE